MSKLRQILRLYTQGEKKLKISSLTGISRNTLKKYLKIYLRLGLTAKDIEALSDRELDRLFGENLVPEPCEKYKTLEAFFPAIEKQLRRRGVTRETLWEGYIAVHPDGYKLSQFKYHYQQWLKRTNPVMHIEHLSGDKMYIDFAGEKLNIVDEETGEITEAEVFISVLGASQLTYVEAVLSQRKEDFITCCEHALSYYGGVPRAIVPDNLKSAVIKSSPYEPTLNQAFENFALHYSTTILPARSYKPKDKSLVEGAVRIAYRRIYAQLDGRIFHTLEELNLAIWEALEIYNNTKFSHRPYTRRQMFEEIERSELGKLPPLLFELKRQQYSTVAVNGHICLREDKHYYSVPYGYIGKKVKTMYSTTHVEIFYNYVLIASHKRDRKPYGYTTNPDHLASTHRYLSEWNPERFIKWAESIDSVVRQFIMSLMDSKSHPEQAYKACQGVLGFERKVGRERLINACKRATEYENYSYHAIKSILENKYDMLTTTEITGGIPAHENIRGKNYYQ
ncbi:MAG: IS21 family transposase [Bacteroidales bacterium]